MLNFEFHIPTKVYFGKDYQHQVGELLSPLAKKVLLHYGGGSVKRSGLYDQVTASLKKSGVDFVELGGVVPNPRLSLVQEGISLCRKEQVDFILAVGGGSAIDSAKAIAIGYYYEGDVWEVYESKKPIERALPVATLLTIPAAGSESSVSSVITNEEKEMKCGYGSPLLRPVFSIVNPMLFTTLPENQTANGVADMMSHIFERYFTNTAHVDLTDALCEGTLRTIMKNAPVVLREPDNYDAWCEIGFSGTVAHNDILGVGRAQDWGCHAMEHELSALYDVAHGAGLAVLTPNWMRYVYRHNIPMFLQFAIKIMGVDGSLREPEELIEEGISRLRRFFTEMGLPATLTELGIGKENLELMAKKCTGVAYGKEKNIGGLKQLDWTDVLEIYKMSL